MYITEIRIDSLPAGQAEDAARAMVAFFSEDAAVSLDCTVVQSRPEKLRVTLLNEAVRQLKRMPEFRTGTRALSFAPGVMAS